MKSLLRILGFTGFSLVLSLSGEAARASNLGIDPSLQNQFSITPFATGLDFPNGIVQLGDGSLVIGTAQGNGFFDPQSKGQLVRFQDNNGDGVADTKTVLYDGSIVGNNLPGGITAIRSIDNYLFVTSDLSSQSRISIFQQGADLSANSLMLKGSLNFSYPAGFVHPSSALAVRQTGAQQYELFFNLGSVGNNQATAPGTVTLNGGNFTSATISGDSLYKIPITVGSNLDISAPVLVATGLRNAAALEIDPTTGALYIGENGIDGLPPKQPNDALTTDELNRLTVAELASPTVENFGFPNYGVKSGAPGVFVDGIGQIVDPTNSGTINPLVAFQPIPDPLTGNRSQGVASIAFAPTAFPTGLNNGVFLGFFGRFNYQPGDDLANPLVYYDLGTGQYSDFLSSKFPGGDFGHFTSLLSTQNSLFAVDIAPGSGALFSAAGLGKGTIYQITPVAQQVPEPSTLLGTAMSLGFVVWLKRRSRHYK
jgi:glucose/arabinose dehydrogenase